MSDRYLIPHTKRVHILNPESRLEGWSDYLCGLAFSRDDKAITTKRIPKGTKLCKRCAAFAKKRGGRR